MKQPIQYVLSHILCISFVPDFSIPNSLLFNSGPYHLLPRSLAGTSHVTSLLPAVTSIVTVKKNANLIWVADELVSAKLCHIASNHLQYVPWTLNTAWYFKALSIIWVLPFLSNTLGLSLCLPEKILPSFRALSLVPSFGKMFLTLFSATTVHY